MTEPIPSGATVIEHSVRGGFERFELSPGAITFYVGNRRQMAPIQYEFYGYSAGRLPRRSRGGSHAYRPEQLAVAALPSR